MLGRQIIYNLQIGFIIDRIELRINFTCRILFDVAIGVLAIYIGHLLINLLRNITILVAHFQIQLVLLIN